MRTIREGMYKWLFATLAFTSLVFLVGIILTLLRESLPIFTHVKPDSFLFGQSWYPTSNPLNLGYGPWLLHHSP